MKAILSELKGKVPESLLDEFEYQIECLEGGVVEKPVILAVLKDIIDTIRENELQPRVIKKTKAGIVQFLNRNEEKLPDDQEFTLSSEPVEDGFVENIQDIALDIDAYRPSNPLEQKGRIHEPISLVGFPDFHFPNLNKSIGVDMARYGDDKTVILIQDHGHVIDIQSYYKQDTHETTGRVVDAIKEHRPDQVLIDGTGGWGAGVLDNLLAAGVDELAQIVEVIFNASPREEKWKAANARAEMFLMLQEKFRLGYVTLPPNKELVEELAWIKYKFTVEGKIILQPKEECKKKNKRSPNHADALALAFYGTPGLTIYW